MTSPQREPPWMAVAAYAVHTTACTYVLDGAGVCHWVLGPNGGPAATMDRCIGAQFVACLDERAPGQLVGELVVGATALFACHDGERFVLLRSPVIEWVEQRTPIAPALHEIDRRAPTVAADRGPPMNTSPDPLRGPPMIARAETTEVLPSPAPGTLPPPVPPPRRLAGFRPETVAVAREFESVADPSPPADQETDQRAPSVEEIVTFSEVTVTMPLYSPAEPPEPQPHRHREALSRGQRLR